MRYQDVTNAKLSRIIGVVEFRATRRVTMVTDNGAPMTKRLITALLLIAGGAGGAQSARPTATRNGFAVDRLARIDRFLQQYVDSNQIAGAVALVMRDGQVVYEKAVGWSDREAGRRMTTDVIFRIASQSKALTSVSIMTLVEEGKIALNDRVSRFIPAFAHTTVATRSDTGRVIAPATREITIRDLLTQTAGINYATGALLGPLYQAKGLGPAAGLGWYFADKDEQICTTIERLATLPFVAQPGEQWVYGYSTDVLGCVVERASGMPFDEFIRTRITQPLGMTDTYFFLPPAKRNRLAAVYASDSANHAVRAPDGPKGQGDYVDGPRKDFSGGAGILSTAHDYARFLQMLLNGGTLGGARILSPKTIDVMTSNQTGTMYSTTGVGFGLGFYTIERLGADNTMSSLGTWGWGGAYASSYRVDPKERLVIVFMINQIPNRSDIAAKFPNLVYQALVQP
jgi:CubicO group peptidase (beta-lactamase class C family)